jgi:hypothetical protein
MIAIGLIPRIDFLFGYLPEVLALLFMSVM